MTGTAPATIRGGITMMTFGCTRRARPTPGQAVDHALAGWRQNFSARILPLAPTGLTLDDLHEPPAPTLDDLADDDAADPICAAARAGAPIDLTATPFQYMSCTEVYEHLTWHGRTEDRAIDEAAALFAVRPDAMRRILTTRRALADLADLP